MTPETIDYANLFLRLTCKTSYLETLVYLLEGTENSDVEICVRIVHVGNLTRGKFELDVDLKFSEYTKMVDFMYAIMWDRLTFF